MITATYRIAHAAAWDAGNRSAKAAGRLKWSRRDYNVAAKTFSQLYPEASHEVRRVRR